MPSSLRALSRRSFVKGSVAGFGAIVAAGLAGCGAGGSGSASAAASAAAASSAARTFDVGIGHLNSTAHLLAFVAKEEGFFEEEGVDATLAQFSSGSELVAGLESGKLQIAFIGSVPALVNQSAGREISIFGGAMTNGHGYVIKSKYTEGLDDWDVSILKGKNVAVPRTTVQELELYQLLAAHGLTYGEDDGGDVNIVLFDSQKDAYNAMANESIDAVSTYSPYTSIAVADVTAVILVVLTAWQLATAGFNVLPEKMFPAPGIVFAQIVADHAKIGQGIASSLGIVAEGYLMGTALALALGLALGFGARTSQATEKVVSFLSAIPPIVYIPYGIALLPTFRASSVLVIFLATLWPVLAGTLAGVSNVDKRILDSARVLNVGAFKTLARVVLPSALPLIFNGLNIALCLSFILLTSAEMIGGSIGMGYYVKYYSDFGDYTRILAGIIVIGVVITFISVFLNKLQKHLTRWK